MNELWNVLMHSEEYLIAFSNEHARLTYLLIVLVVFLESGNLLFVFLPGDGFLFIIGVIAASGALSIWLVVILLVLAAVSGYYLNYNTGKYYGRKMLRKNRWISRRYLRKTFRFIRDHGTKAVILGRFFPVVRTVLPFIAGVGNMEENQFRRDTIIGALLWIIAFVLGGYFLGGFSFVRNNFLLFYLIFVVLTLSPIVVSGLKRLWPEKGTNE